jgi:hypothetical protein
MTDNATSRIGVACAALHADGEGNIVPCPGYPHTESEPQHDARSRPLGSDGQPFCTCEHERQRHFGDHLDCHGYDCICKKYEPLRVSGQPELTACPHCTDAVVDLNEHLKSCREYRQIDPVTHARQLLADHQAAQANACQAEIQAVLDRYNMRLEVSTPQIAIVPNP